MDYMQEDPYPSHRFGSHDAYYSGGGGGGGYDGNYASNTSFDQRSEHSVQSDRHRPVKSYSDMPNGGPYGSSNNIIYPPPDSQQQMRASPQPTRSLSPPDYSPPGMVTGGGDMGHFERESPYHNLPPYEERVGGDGDFDGEYYDDRDKFVPSDPHSEDFVLPPHPTHPYAEEDMHAGFGQR